MRTTTTALLALTAAAAVAIPTVAQAASSPSPNPSPSASAKTAAPQGGPWAGQGPMMGRQGRGAERTEMVADLAKRLGVTTEKLTAALKTVRDKAEAAGETRLGPDATAAQRLARQDEHAARLASALGLPVAQVKAAVTAHRAAEKAERLAELKTRLAAAVKAGRLTQAQADAVYAAVRDGKRPTVALPFGGTGGRHGMGGRGGMGGRDGMGGRGGMGNATQSPSTTGTSATGTAQTVAA